MAIYYVSTTGRNTDLGTLEKPWGTLAYAESKLSSGDVVYVRGGTYQNGFVLDIDNVTFKNYLNEIPIIDGEYLRPAGDPGEWASMIQVKSDNATIDGFVVKRVLGNGIQIYKGKNATIRNCEVFECQRKCFHLYQGADNALIEDCDIHHGAHRYITHPWEGVNPATVSIRHSKGATFRRCKIRDSYYEGFNLDNESSDNLVEYSEIYGSIKNQIYMVCSKNNVIRYNLIYGTDAGRGQGIWMNVEADNCNKDYNGYHKIYGNFVANTRVNLWIAGGPGREMYGCEIYNNTFIEQSSDMTQAAIQINANSGGGHIFKNNIIWQTDGLIARMDSGAVDCDNNLWSRIPDTNAQGPNDPPYALPKLTKTSGWNNLIGGELIPEDFMLQPDSPAIDKGTYIEDMIYDFFVTPIPQGSAPDIGAVEYTSSNPCEGVVCENVCVGKDLWSQKCVDGSCIPDKLIASNSPTCGYDPCDGVVCENICIGKDLWSQKCVDGSCIPDKLIASNSPTCEYDLCDGVVCENICVGNDLWSQSCDPGTGNCVANQLLQQDSINCKIPDQVPSDESTIKTYIILGGFGLMGLAMLILRKK